MGKSGIITDFIFNTVLQSASAGQKAESWWMQALLIAANLGYPFSDKALYRLSLFSPVLLATLVITFFLAR
jgi:hypothetical protein